MKNIIWKLRYAIRLSNLAGISWRFAWELTERAIKKCGEVVDSPPEQCAETEFSDWMRITDVIISNPIPESVDDMKSILREIDVPIEMR